MILGVTIKWSLYFVQVDSVIQETKNLMNAVAKVVTTCFICATKVTLGYNLTVLKWSMWQGLQTIMNISLVYNSLIHICIIRCFTVYITFWPSRTFPTCVAMFSDPWGPFTWTYTQTVIKNLVHKRWSSIFQSRRFPPIPTPQLLQ